MTKAQLIEENEKLRRTLFIYQNIGISPNSKLRTKENAAKHFLLANPNYTAYEVCKIIGLSRGTLHNFMNKKVENPWFKERNKLLTKEIKTIFEESNGMYGQNRIQLALKEKGINTTTVTIAKIMRKNHLEVKENRQRPSVKIMNRKRKLNHKANLLNQQFNQTAPNKVWVSDFMELILGNVKYYLCVILDLFSKMVIGWRLSHKLSDSLALLTFGVAFENRGEPEGLLFHTDQGSQFKSHKFMDSLGSYGVTQSFSNPGRPYDNACMESFYSTLRREETNVHADKYTDSRTIKDYLSKYFYKYNNERIHTTLKTTPQKKEDEWYKNRKLNQ